MKSYVVQNSAIKFNEPVSVTVIRGDIIMFDPANGNRVSVYRGSQLLCSFAYTAAPINTMEKKGWISEIVNDPAPTTTDAQTAAETIKNAQPTAAEAESEVAPTEDQTTTDLGAVITSVSTALKAMADGAVAETKTMVEDAGTAVKEVVSVAEHTDEAGKAIVNGSEKVETLTEDAVKDATAVADAAVNVAEPIAQDVETDAQAVVTEGESWLQTLVKDIESGEKELASLSRRELKKVAKFYNLVHSKETDLVKTIGDHLKSL